MQKLLITFLLIWWVKPLSLFPILHLCHTYPTSNLDNFGAMAQNPSAAHRRTTEKSDTAA